MWLKTIKKDVNRSWSFTRIPFTRPEPCALTAKGISCWRLTPALFLAYPWLTEAAGVGIVSSHFRSLEALCQRLLGDGPLAQSSCLSAAWAVARFLLTPSLSFLSVLLSSKEHLPKNLTWVSFCFGGQGEEQVVWVTLWYCEKHPSWAQVFQYSGWPQLWINRGAGNGVTRDTELYCLGRNFLLSQAQQRSRDH